MPVHRTCRQCGSAFTVVPSRVLTGGALYCSNPCRVQSSMVRLDRSCQRCGITMAARGVRRKYCSQACYIAAHTVPLVDRFWPKVQKSDSCWEWTANHLPKGYGVISAGGRRQRLMLAHRVAYEMASGEPIPEGLDVLHTCDNPPCVRNDEASFYILDGIAHLCYGHLFLGTVKDNAIDMVEKGRAPMPWAKLTPEMVREIRQRFAAGGITKTRLAAEYGISGSSIGDAINRRTWRYA